MFVLFNARFFAFILHGLKGSEVTATVPGLVEVGYSAMGNTLRDLGKLL